MNREQIEPTPAGPELDRLVAEAKGYEEPQQWDNGYFLHEPPQDDIVFWFPMPPWSTDIAAAWELVEEICVPAPDGCWTGPHFSLVYDSDTWQACFDYLDSIDLPLHQACMNGTTAPEAITRAYLLAKLEAEP